MICSVCGVTCAKARSGAFLHTDVLPRGVPDHDALPVAPDEFKEAQKAQFVNEDVLDFVTKAFITYGTHLATCDFRTSGHCSCGYLATWKQMMGES